MTAKKPTPPSRPKQPPRALSVAELSDAEVLKQTMHGKLGPGIVGEEMHARSVAILKGSAGGKLGPAIVEHDYDVKEKAARRAAEEAQAEAERALDDDTLLDRYEREALAAGYRDEVAERIAQRRLKALRTGQSFDEVGEEPGGTDSESEVDVPAGDVDPTNLQDPRNPWTYVTLSGAKQLAIKSGVSYVPKVTRRDLVAQLQAAGVVPPPAPDADDLKKADARDDRDDAVTG